MRYMKKIFNSLILFLLIIIISVSCKESIKYKMADYEKEKINKNSVKKEYANHDESIEKENVWDKWDYPEDEVLLNWYIIGTKFPKDEKMVEEEINAYLKEKINAKVDLKFYDFDESYYTPIREALKTGKDIDILFTSGWLNTEFNYFTLARNGYLYNLNNYYDDGGYLEETKKILGTSFLNGSKVENNYYGVSCNKEKAYHRGMLLRKDIVDDLGINVNDIKTFKDMEEYYSKVKENYDVYPLVAIKQESPIELLMWNYMINKNIPLALYPDNRDNNVVNIFEAPETIDYLYTIRDFYKKGYVHSEGSWTELLKEGNIFSIQQPLKPGKDIEMSVTSKVDYIQADINFPVISNNEAVGSIMSIYKYSDNPDRAAMLLEIANTDKYLNNLLNFGIEGYHFNKIDENIIKFTEKRKDYNINLSWVFPNTMMNYIVEGEDIDKFKHYEEYNTIALPLNNLGFTFETEEYKDIIEEVSEVMNDIISKEFYNGALEIEPNLKKIKEDLEKAGIEELRLEIQRQYDEWLKENR